MMLEYLVIACLLVNPKDFGAVGDGIADDTAAIQAAADDCASKLRVFQPTGGSYHGSCPELFIPAGKYKITAVIRVCPYQAIRGEDSILMQADSNVGILNMAGGYQNRVVGLQFYGGSRQVTFSNANVDSSFLTFRDCAFQGWSEYSVFAEGTVDDLHLSTTLSFTRCRWDGPRAIYTHCDTTQVSDCEVHFRGSSIPNGGAWITNAGFTRPNGNYSYGGTLGMSNVTLVPAAPIVPAEDGSSKKSVNAYWIDNGGSVVVTRVRCGGEGGGIPVIYHRAPINLQYPRRWSKVIIEYSQTSCGQDADNNAALLTLAGGFPQCLRIVGCDSLVSATIPIVRVAPGYDIAKDAKAIVAAGKQPVAMTSIMIQGNQYFATQPLPAPLQQFVK